MLKRNESTIYRWLKAYKQGGITELLTVKKAPGKTPHIPPEVREKLIKKLQEPQTVLVLLFPHFDSLFSATARECCYRSGKSNF
jgi:transposase